MKISTLCVLLALLAPAAVLADERIGFNILESEFKGGIIVYKVEVIENLMEERLPNKKELLWVAEQLIGDRGSDPRRKLIQFWLPGLTGETGGAYATAQMQEGPIEISRNAFALFDHAQYKKYVDENLEFIE